jgi:hypothetical protein
MIGKSIPGSGAMEGGGAYNRHATIPAQGAAAAVPYLEAAARAVSFDSENDPVVIADCDLTIESCETLELVDPAWKGYELGGAREALAIRHAAFYRSVFAPSLASWLVRGDEPEARRKFADRLERGLMQRIKAEPAPVNSLVETMVFAKSTAA